MILHSFPGRRRGSDSVLRNSLVLPVWVGIRDLQSEARFSPKNLRTFVPSLPGSFACLDACSATHQQAVLVIGNSHPGLDSDLERGFRLL